MKIVAISGGKLRAGNNIDKEIIRLTGKVKPNILFLPTASEYPGSSSMDSETNYKLFQDSFEKKLGCKTDVLYLVKEKHTKQEIKKKILSSDIIYVGGGSTLKLLKVWRKLGVDKVLKQAYKKGIVLSGISAGGICWFKYGHTIESVKKGKRVMKVRGLDFFPFFVCPHYDNQKFRKPSLRRMIKKYGGFSIALDAFSAIEIVDGQYKIITSSKSARAYRVYLRKGKVVEEELPKDKKFRPLAELFKR
ncbi:MAG: Type 1 glutamine amidotransferase-like domain-containing protein [Nanoarchaeota archaeon]|nr:Type 1 glutamine amidotransferase-like domain-containing protein [Nanoarchaeota archaeon]